VGTISLQPKNLPKYVPGLALAGIVAFVGFAISWKWTSVSPLTASVVLGALLGNLGVIPTSFDKGLKYASKQILRAGIVVLGLQLSFSQVAKLGGKGFLAVAIVVTITFFGTQLIAKWLGISKGLGLLTATGYSICGVSAVSAMVGAVEGTDEDATYAIALVTLFGSLSIFVLPILGHAAGLSHSMFGAWAGSAVHDVAQVVATATAYSKDSLAPATIVKLTRVVLLAPLVAGMALRHRRGHRVDHPQTKEHKSAPKPAPLPLFIVLFLVMVGVRTSNVLHANVLADFKKLEKTMLAMALVGLGAGVRFKQMRSLGIRPILLGVFSWLLVMIISFVSIHLIHFS